MDLKDIIENRNWDCIILDLDQTLIGLKVDWDELKKFVLTHRSFRNLDALKGLDQNIFDLKRHLTTEEFLSLCNDISKFELREIGQAKINWPLCSMLESFDGLVCVFSSNCRRTIIQALDVINLKKDFSLIVGKEDVDYPKPSSCGLEIVLEKLNLNRGSCLYIGDSENDLIPGKKANISTVRILPMSTQVSEVFLSQ